jgi:hypothetical protein
VRDQETRVTFHDGTFRDVPGGLPLNTMDKRYGSCDDHHLACLCREAEYREELAELRSEDKATWDTMATVLLGHAIHVCDCTGCVVTRACGRTHQVTMRWANARHASHKPRPTVTTGEAR